MGKHGTNYDEMYIPAEHPCRCQKVGKSIACGKQYLQDDEYCQKDRSPNYWNQTKDA